MAKPVVKYKTYKQSAQVGGKIYGVPYLGDPQIASVTMQEVIDYCKLHNYSAAQLESLMSQVISGVADLVARDGRPRNLSDLLKFEPKLKGTFGSLESGVTNQKLVIRPRLLKEMRVNLPIDTFAWQNQNDTTGPKFTNVAWFGGDTNHEIYDFDYLRTLCSSAPDEANLYGVSMNGDRLAPDGWKAGMDVAIYLKRGTMIYRLDSRSITIGEQIYECGIFDRYPQSSTENNLRQVNKIVDVSEGQIFAPAWYEDGSGVAQPVDNTWAPQLGDLFTFVFSRTLESDGTTAVTEKSYALNYA